MSDAIVVPFSTPVVREMTREEYFEQPRRVIASLTQERTDEPVKRAA